MKYAFLFPGQGSQSIGMGKAFYDNFAIAKTFFERAEEALKIDMKHLLFEENDKLHLTQYTQSAIFLVSAIAYHILQNEYPLTPSVAMGHSLGEVSAVALSDGMDFENAIKLIYARGELMAKACDGKNAGMMVVMGVNDDALELFCQNARNSGRNIWCANYNSDGQVVLAGIRDDLSASESEIKALGAKRALLLPMSVASHCPLLESARVPFVALLESYLNETFNATILSNATLESYTTKARAKTLLSEQLIRPVLYKQSIMRLNNEVDAFIEFGNGSVLRGLNKRLSDKPTWNVSDVATLKECIDGVQSL